MGNKDVVDFVLLYIKSISFVMEQKITAFSLLDLCALGSEIPFLINVQNHYGLKFIYCNSKLGHFMLKKNHTKCFMVWFQTS